SSPSCNSPLQAKSGGCFRCFSARRNGELNYEPSSNLFHSKRKNVASRSLRKLVGAFQRKTEENNAL
ncbi:hypothetical protein KI387_018022, partial [Taxus chinensis]